MATACKVKFAYKRRAVDPKNKKTFREKIFTVSPYALIWKDDHYYLVCNNEKYDNLMKPAPGSYAPYYSAEPKGTTGGGGQRV